MLGLHYVHFHKRLDLFAGTIQYHCAKSRKVAGSILDGVI